MCAALFGAGALLWRLPSVHEGESAHRGLLPRPHSTLYSQKQLVRPGLRLLPAGRLGSRLEVGLGLFPRLCSPDCALSGQVSVKQLPPPGHICTQNTPDFSLLHTLETNY